MRYLWYIILFSIFVYTTFSINKCSNEEKEQINKYLYNGVEFEGYVIACKQSSNHAFGIDQLKITKANVKEFNKTLKEGIYPYRIKGDTAELYCTVSIQRKRGDIVKVVSNQKMVYYNHNTTKEKGDINIITLPFNIDYVKEHTIFKD